VGWEEPQEAKWLNLTLRHVLNGKDNTAARQIKRLLEDAEDGTTIGGVMMWFSRRLPEDVNNAPYDWWPSTY
jgi:hypothetical protein